MLTSAARRMLTLVVSAGLFLLLAATMSNAEAFLRNTMKFPDRITSNNYRSSDHFTIIWGNSGPESGYVTEQAVQGNLQMLEQLWKVLHWAPPVGMGIRHAGSSFNPTYSEQDFKADLAINQTGAIGSDGEGYGGGAWGSCDQFGLPLFGLPIGYLRFDPPSGATPHEYGHTVLINKGGFNGTPWDGCWHEASANWIQLQFLDSYPGVGAQFYNHAASMPHGRNYYDAWWMWEFYKDNPDRWGGAFFSKLWEQALGDQNKPGGPEYMFDAMVRLNTSGAVDKYNDIKDAMGLMVRQNMTWESYKRGQFFRQQCPIVSDSTVDQYRRGYSELIREPGNPGWFRLPWKCAPMPGGEVHIPIALNGKTGGGYIVNVNFQPLWDNTRGTDFRATLVAVNNNGDSRYSQMWNNGVNSITLSADENKLYLVAIATSDFKAFGIATGYPINEPTSFPQTFRVAFPNTLATAYESVPAAPAVGHGYAVNGGGFVASTASVAATAYVGPKAMVLENAKVQGYARIEDYAVVKGNATVKDYAVVSGHALVRDNAVVSGNAKVRDWGTVVGSSQVFDYAKVYDEGYADGEYLHDSATIKGWCYDYCGAPGVGGYAIKDGDCANGSTLNKGVGLCWVWGFDQNYMDTRPDNAWRFCEYTFERPSPVYALDTFGIIVGYLQGATTKPSVVTDGDAARNRVLSLNGTDQYVELYNHVSDFREVTYGIWVKWNGGAANQMIYSMGDGAARYMTLTPDDGTGNLKLSITNTGSAGVKVLSAPAVPVNTWTHIAVTFGSPVFTAATKTWTATGTLYVNGVQMATLAGMTPPDQIGGSNTSNADNFNFLGRGNTGGFFSGSIDSFVTFQKTFTPAEVAAIGTPAQGLRGDYFTGVNFFKLLTSRLEPTLNLNWGSAYPDPAVTAKPFSVRWSGKVQPRYSETYTFYGTVSDDAIRVWVNGVQLINKWSVSPPNTSSGTIALTAGQKYDIRVDYYDYSGSGSCKLEWQSASQTREVVPQICLWPDGVLPTTKADTIAPTPSTAAFLLVPTALTESDIVMTAVRGTDASASIEYYFTCVSGGGHDSGWISSSKYTDLCLTPNTTYSYKVKMRDMYGNTTADSTVLSATTMASGSITPAVPTFSGPPAGISTTAIKMTATKGASAGSLVEYKFDRIVPPTTVTASTGWQSSPVWTDTVPAGSTNYYRLQMRDVHGTMTTYSAILGAKAEDKTAPTRYNVGEWSMRPYATIDNCACMTANDLKPINNNETIYYRYICSENASIDSGWVTNPVWKTAPLPIGTYSFKFSVKDAAGNETGYSSLEQATITNTTGFHSYDIKDINKEKDGTLATVSGIVTAIFSDGFYISSTDRLAHIKVLAPSVSTSYFMNCPATVTGCLDTLTGERIIRYISAKVDYKGPVISLDASSLTAGTVTNWSNAGMYGGTFNSNTGTVTAATLSSKKCVTFDGASALKASFTTPLNLNSNNSYTVAVRAYNPALADEESILAWAPRSGDSYGAQFGFGTGGGGAVNHNSMNINFGTNPTANAWHLLAYTYDGTTEKVYVDGVLKNTRTYTLNMWTSGQIYLGSSYSWNWDTNAWNPNTFYSGSISSLRVYQYPMSAAEVATLGSNMY